MNLQNKETYIDMNNKSSDEKSDYLHFVLEQFNKAGYNDYTIIIANILDQYDASNYSLLIHTSVFDKMMFLEKTIEYLDEIKLRNEKGDAVLPQENLWYNYGRIYFANKMYSDAQPYFLNYYQRSDSNAVVNHLLGMTYLYAGEKEKARKIFSHNKSLNDKSQMEYINRSIRQLNKM